MARRDVAKAAPPPSGVLPVKGDEAPAALPPGVAVPPKDAAPGPVVPAGGLDLLAKLDPKILVGRLAALQAEMERLPIEIHSARSRMRELEGKIEALKKAPVEDATMAAVDNDPAVRDQAARATRAKAAYDFAASAGRPDAPDVVNLKSVWQAQNARLTEVRREKANLLEGGKRVEEGRRLAAAWEEIKHQLERYEAQFATARAGMARVERQLNEMPDPVVRVSADGRPERLGPSYDPANTNLMSLDALYARLVTRHEAIKLDLQAGQRIRLLQPGSSPMQKDIKKHVLGTVAGGLFGYVVIAMGVVAFETVSRRVSSLADLKTAGPAAIVGVIPGLPADATGRDPSRRAAANEAIDKLRAYVAQTWLSRGATCVAVTSPLGDEGKALTAFGLASSLAQAGYKTLLADFDLREPTLHGYAGVPNQAGACEVLRGEVDPRSAVVTLPSGLAFLPAGKWSDEARQAAVGGRLEQVLGKLKEPFDCVVLHGHALLTVAESVEIARRCEVVLVCARYRETKLPLLQKATDRLAALEVPYSGVVYVGATESEALC
jgi:Mrp family chromosome partitioning ATPase